MLGRYRRRRLGPAFAWLGVAFYSSEIPRSRRSSRHSGLRFLSRASGRPRGIRRCGIGTEITAHAGHPFSHEGSCAIAKNLGTSSAATAAAGDIETFEERGSPWRFRQIYLARVADKGAI